ncbi:hypothetical protein [Mesorhizobium sp. WSM4884]|uniref:hypothetical protein n=1 Tax=Mesorhizobium sp. WSM4884 TaxID=3038542 RepID=UPI002417E6E2|nr:hypothetical protein [Mesorhizobium sp. WSM4884]MDG4882851.1 hypothetical protein [Mesorhizobium sp. WSM4884]
MDDPKPTSKKQRRLSAFELDSVREAFRRSVRENNVTEANWAEHAKTFIENMIGKHDAIKQR